MLFLSFLVAFLTGVALGEVTVPFVAIDRKGTRSPTFGRQRVGAPFVDVPLENADLAVSAHTFLLAGLDMHTYITYLVSDEYLDRYPAPTLYVASGYR